MSRYVDIEPIIASHTSTDCTVSDISFSEVLYAPSIDIVRCQDCKKSHIDGKTTHNLWCTEWGRSADTFGYCERGEREGE